MDHDLRDVLTLTQAARLIGRSPITLRWAAREGKLDAQRVGRDWLTDNEALAEYMVRYVRGPIGYGEPSGRRRANGNDRPPRR